MKTMEGLATSSTPMVRRLRCSTLRPLCPGRPTRLPFSDPSSISSITCAHAGQSLSDVSLYNMHKSMRHPLTQQSQL